MRYAVWNEDKHIYEEVANINAVEFPATGIHVMGDIKCYRENPKEIHFYAFPCEKTRNNGCIHDYLTLELAILRQNKPYISTTLMGCMSFKLQDTFGYDIYVHDNVNDPMDCYCISYDIRQCPKTNRQMRQGHNIAKMWVAGEFGADWDKSILEQ